jgi:hypothetical protein
MGSHGTIAHRPSSPSRSRSIGGINLFSFSVVQRGFCAAWLAKGGFCTIAFIMTWSESITRRSSSWRSFYFEILKGLLEFYVKNIIKTK